MRQQVLPTLSEVLAFGESALANCLREKVQACKSNITSPIRSENENVLKRVRAEREWSGAIAALEQLLLQSIDLKVLVADDYSSSAQGLVLAGPVPVLSHVELLSYLPTWTFTAEPLTRGIPFQLPPAIETDSPMPRLSGAETVNTVPLLTDDPLAAEQFCLALTAQFSFVMVLGEDSGGDPTFLFSFDPEVVEQAWRTLRARMLLIYSQSSLEHLDALFERYYPIAPDYRLVTRFSQLLLKYLPESLEVGDKERGRQGEGETERKDYSFSSPPPHLTPYPFASHPHGVGNIVPSSASSIPRPDVELLQAFAHEVRTPLTTIRTLTRLLLKRRDLNPEIVKRLEIIDHECTAQIDRMELLFRAAELEISTAKPTNTHLTAMSLAQVLQQSIPRWHQSANRRNLTLDVVLPQQLPTVVSDPRMLDQVLTGLIENFTRSLPAGSHIQVQVVPAGDQLKLQLLPQSQPGESGEAAEPLFVPPPLRKSLGQLLMFQPETGNISLNLTATKHLFQAIGGKLIVRQRPHQAEVLTVFLPLEISNNVQLS